MWDKLSMAEKAKYIRLGVQNGITSLNDIKEVYNTYADGGPYSAGKMSDALYEAAKKVERLGDPDHHYDFNQTDEWADAHGYYLDNRGHRDDRVKKLAHPTHPSRGKWNGLNEFQLTELGMKDPNYTMFGMADGDQDPQATLTYKGDIVLPEITVTPKANYIHNSYDNLNIKYGIGGTLRKRIRSALGKSTNRQDTRINTRQFQSGNTEQVDRTNVRRVNPSQVQNKIQDNQNKAVHRQILERRYPQAAADGMDYEGLVNLDKSTTPVSFNGKVYVGGNYQPQETSYSQDNKSNQEHKQAQAAFIQNQEQQRKEDEIKQTVELLNNPYNPIGWIPGLRSVVNAGADQNYFRTYNTAFTPYTADAAFSTAGDAVTLGFGLGPYKNYAGSYAGTVAGGLIGEQFDNPQLGQIIGGITGGFSPQIYNTSKEFLSNKVGPTSKGIESPRLTSSIRRSYGAYEVGQPLALEDILTKDQLHILDLVRKDVAPRLRNALSDEGYLMTIDEKNLVNNGVADKVTYFVDGPDFGKTLARAYGSKKIGIPINRIPKTGFKDFTLPIDEVVVHELEHIQRSALQDEAASSRLIDRGMLKQRSKDTVGQIIESKTYTPEEANLLDDAYTFTDEYLSNTNDKYLSPIKEKGATNRQLRSKIIRETGLVGDELDSYIDNMPDEALIKKLENINGYSEDFFKQFLEENEITPGSKEVSKAKVKEKADKIRKALKYVALNNTDNNIEYIA